MSLYDCAYWLSKRVSIDFLFLRRALSNQTAKFESVTYWDPNSQYTLLAFAAIMKSFSLKPWIE